MESNFSKYDARFPIPRDLPVLLALQVTFEPITLYRPMQLFGAALGLVVGVPSRPDRDFLVHLVEGSGHQQLVRAAVHPYFKNFENFVRRKNRTTGTTKRLLHARLGAQEDELDVLVHGRRDGPLLPFYVNLFSALEGLFMRTYGTVTIGTARCRCCGADMLDDVDNWWHEQALRIDRGAYRFVDRLLKVALGAAILMALVKCDESIDPARLRDLAAPDIHPVGHWIDMVRLARGLRHDWELTVGTGDHPDGGGPVPQGRINKWRSGQNLLPMERAQAMMAGASGARSLKQALIAARTMALAIDVLQAAAETPGVPIRRTIQELVAARLAQLEKNLLTGAAALSSRSRSKT